MRCLSLLSKLAVGQPSLGSAAVFLKSRVPGRAECPGRKLEACEEHPPVPDLSDCHLADPALAVPHLGPTLHPGFEPMPGETTTPH